MRLVPSLKWAAFRHWLPLSTACDQHPWFLFVRLSYPIPIVGTCFVFFFVFFFLMYTHNNHCLFQHVMCCRGQKPGSRQRVVVVTVVVVMVVVSIKFTFLCRHYSSFTTAASMADREAFVQQQPCFGQQKTSLMAFIGQHSIFLCQWY